MVKPGQVQPAPVGCSGLTVSWRASRSKFWHQYDVSVGRAILAAAASGKPTVNVTSQASDGERLRRSLRLEERKKRGASRGPKSADAVSLVTFESMRQTGPSSNAHRTLRWAFSSMTGWFDRLPTKGAALAAMIAGCQAAEKRRVLSELLNYLTSAPCLESFLSRNNHCGTFSSIYDYITGRFNNYEDSITDVSPNADHAKPGTMLYERILDVLVQHAAIYGDALQALMGSKAQ